MRNTSLVLNRDSLVIVCPRDFIESEGMMIRPLLLCCLPCLLTVGEASDRLEAHYLNMDSSPPTTRKVKDSLGLNL